MYIPPAPLHPPARTIVAIWISTLHVSPPHTYVHTPYVRHGGTGGDGHHVLHVQVRLAARLRVLHARITDVVTPDHVGDGLCGKLVVGLEGGKVGGGVVLVVALEYRLGARVGALN